VRGAHKIGAFRDVQEPRSGGHRSLDPEKNTQYIYKKKKKIIKKSRTWAKKKNLAFFFVSQSGIASVDPPENFVSSPTILNDNKPKPHSGGNKSISGRERGESVDVSDFVFIMRARIDHKS
jgi:hypothetical protein